MGETTHQHTQPSTRARIPAVASPAIEPDRLTRMWAMNADQRLQAAQTAHLTLGEMLRWAARAPHEVPLLNGEFFFITDLAE